MTDERVSSGIEKLWQDQSLEPHRMPPEELRRRMNKFQRRIFWRNIREYIAGAIVVAGFGYYEWKFPGLLLRIGSGLTILGALYVMFQLHRRASAEPAASDLGRSTYLEFHRRELIRQHDALRSVWSWYLLPFVPGLSVFMAGLAKSAMNTARVAGHPLSALLVAGFAVAMISFVAAVFVGVWFLNRWIARKLQAEVVQLDALARDPD